MFSSAFWSWKFKLLLVALLVVDKLTLGMCIWAISTSSRLSVTNAIPLDYFLELLTRGCLEFELRRCSIELEFCAFFTRVDFAPLAK